MAKIYKIDKIFSSDSTYRMEPDKYLVITAIGTDASSKLKVLVDGAPVAEIVTDIAPLHKTSSNLLGPMSLDDLYIVVPPDKVLSFDGPSGAKVRIKGKLVVLGPGEAMINEHAARYEAQFKSYWKYLDATKTLGTDVALSAGEEVEVTTVQPTTIERYVFSKWIGVSVSGGTFSEGDLALRLFYDGAPLDNLLDTMAKKGIDVLALPFPPSDSAEEEAFSLSDFVIEVEGDHRLTLKIVNTSGGSLAPATGSAWSFRVVAPYKYLIVK